MKLELVTKREFSYVELQRDKNHSLGFTITDGTLEEGRPVVKNVNINGPAAKCFAVAVGDIIMSVNGLSTAGKSSKNVRRMLDDAGSNVNLRLLYEAHETRILRPCIYRKQQMTLRFQKIKGSFGFLLRKCSKCSFIMEYPVISNIKEGTLIHKSGHLQDGDRLLMVDNVSLSWMSLSYIASLLQTKDEAEFTFEYSVGVVNFAEMDTIVNFEIDAPVVNLGISFRMCDEECSVMCISNIRQGSAAERCGIFSEGDIILSINNIDKKNLTISRANFLLRNVKRNRKISFISNRRKDVEILEENAGFSSSDDTVITESFASGIQKPDRKHINIPASSNFTPVDHQNYNFQSFCYTEQIKSMDDIQNMFSILSRLKQALSSLTRTAFSGTQTSLNQNCTFCNNTKHAIKLCTSCLARMNVQCAESIDVLRESVAHFVKCSSSMFVGNKEQLLSVSLRNIVHMLKETLPNILPVPELQEHLNFLAGKVSRADLSCNACDVEIRHIMVILKQLLLLLSARGSGEEFQDLIEHLVCCLLDIKFPCFGESEHLHSITPKKDNCFDKKSPESVCIEIDEKCSSDDSTCSEIRNNSETESNRISPRSSFNSLHLETGVYNDYLKLTHIQSMSESKESSESNPQSSEFAENGSENRTSTPKKTVADETSFKSFLSEDLRGNHVKKYFKNMKSSKIWKSQDSLVKLKRNSNGPNLNQSRNQATEFKATNKILLNQNLSSSTTNRKEDLDGNVNRLSVHQNKSLVTNNDDPNLSCSSYKLCKKCPGTSSMRPSTICEPNRSSRSYNKTKKHLLPNNIGQEEESIVNGKSASSSSIYAAGTRSSNANRKTYPETMNITLKKENDTFGLGISEKIPLELPVIDAIEPKSPSYNVGVLKLGDRILAINGAKVSTLSSNRFALLKNKALAADTINLTIEFDVYDEKYLFGLFDVVLDRTLKIGLIFEDMKKSSPIVISGIAKGSGAHRSGQIFPGDEITFIKYTKNEDFDPLTCSFNEEKNAIFTVMRDPQKILGLKEKPHNPSPCYVNPCFQEEVLPQSGQNFVVKKTSVHSSHKNSLVVDHEVTLYRDSTKFDFGILLGEDQVTGRAYVTDIRPDGPAHKSGVIKKFDRIVEVDGILVDCNEENSVLNLLAQANHKVDLLIRRVYQEELTEI